MNSSFVCFWRLEIMHWYKCMISKSCETHLRGNIARKIYNIKMYQNDGEIAELLGKIWALECQMRQNR